MIQQIVFGVDIKMKKLLQSCRQKLLLWICTLGVFYASFFSFPIPELNAQNKFEDMEVRVIRPRYFNKKFRLELGLAFTAVMNQNFIYTYLGTGLLSFHFAEWIGLEVMGSFGFSIDKTDKTFLFDEKGIRTLIERDKYDVFGSLVLTPIYGKYQLTSGRLVYFDTFFTLGAGLSGLEYLFDHCSEDIPVPADRVESYLGFQGGIGQRFFLSKNTSIRWDVRGRYVVFDERDGNCLNNSTNTADSEPYQLANPDIIERQRTSIFMQLGMSYFL